MKNADYKDKSLIIDILTKSFDTNQSVNYIAKQDEKRLKRISEIGRASCRERVYVLV